MSVSVAISSSVVNAAKSIPASANAWSLGANTVKGPSLCNVATNPDADNALTKDV